MAIYSMLEVELERLASIYTAIVEDFPKHPSIFKLKVFLKKIPHFEFPESDAWHEIENLNKLRNAVVHQAGFVDRATHRAELEAYVVASHPLLRIDDVRRVEIAEGFLDHAVTVITTFFGELSTSCLKLTELAVIDGSD